MKRLAVTGCVAIGTVGVLAAAMSGARAGDKSASIEQERDLVVTLVTPTNNQEVLPDLSDPGLNNVITVRFSSLLNTRDIVDNQNVVNRLSPRVEFLDANFSRLPGTPSVRRNIFTFSPLSFATPVLPQGQYTLNIKSSIRNSRGRMLNNGVSDFTTTFSVGTDVYTPVLRTISPIDGQQGIGLFQPIVATFSEPISLSTLLTSVTVRDASTNPPTAIPGAGGTGLTLARNGFDVVFTPDPCFGYPPKTNIEFILQGNNNGAVPNPGLPVPVSTALQDVFQNKFTRDPGLRWSVDPTNPNLWTSPLGKYDQYTGQFKLTFQTKGIKPQPQGIRPGGPQMVPGLLGGILPFGGNCSAGLYYSPSCYVSGNVVHYTTTNGMGEVDLRNYIARYNQGITDFSLINVLANSPVRLGRPAGVTFDPRLIGPAGYTPAGVPIIGPSTFHTFIYVVDERTGTVEIVRSDNLRILGRLTGFSSPRDVSVSTNTNQTSTTLYVSNFGANQLVAVNLEGIKVSYTGQPGAPSPCAVIKDNTKQRTIIQVGNGPTDVSADCYVHSRVMVVNTLDSSMSMIDVQTNKVLKTYEVGSNPVSCDKMTWAFGAIRIAMIANQGGLTDPDGSISMFLNSPPIAGGYYLYGAAQNRDGVEFTLTEGVKNPTNVWGNQKWIDPPPPNGTLSSIPYDGRPYPGIFYVSNTGGTSIVQLAINLSGVFGIAIAPYAVATYDVGLNPTSATGDGYFPLKDIYASVVGTGSLAALVRTRSLPAESVLVPGIRRLITPFSN